MTTQTVAGGHARAVGTDDGRRILVILGAPGAGKGTQAERLAAELGLPHVSTGELFRDALRAGDGLGEHVRAYVEKGRLVPDDLAIEVVRARLRRDDAAAGAILDGFPRTRAQAEALDRMLAKVGSRVTAALYVEVAPEKLVERLTGRRICAKDDQHVYHVSARPAKVADRCDLDGARLVRRRDDEPETVRSRLERQMPPMYEVIDHYADAGVLSAVQGDQPADLVTEDLLRCLGSAARP